jgi:class 3 adenylate cyclase
MDVATWLKGLGLERYVPAFCDNDVDAKVLPKLTADDLIGLGVTSIGHRRKLLDAIAAFGAEGPATVATAAPHDAPEPANAERRQLTVMFCDLAGSTALSSRLDPEDLRDLLGAYHAAVAEVVARFEAYVAKYMGDGAARAGGACLPTGMSRGGTHARRLKRQLSLNALYPVDRHDLHALISSVSLRRPYERCRRPGRRRDADLRAERGQRGILTGIMLAFRLAIIQHEPPIMRKTISRPKARARILFV